MAKSGLQKTWVRILLTVLTLALMAVIFFFSTETAEKSDATSGQITEQVIDTLHPDYETYPEIRKKKIYDATQRIVRKAAHFFEYLVLGVLLRLCLESWFGSRPGLSFASWASGSLYAGTDELHQLITDGRSGQWSDVLLDSGGVLAGVLAASFVLWLVFRNAGRKETKA